MEKIRVSQLLEYGKRNYLKTKLDENIKDNILKKTIYKKSIFSNVFKYTSVLASFIVVIFIGYFYLNIEKAQPSYLGIKEEINNIIPENKNKSIKRSNNLSDANIKKNIANNGISDTDDLAIESDSNDLSFGGFDSQKDIKKKNDFKGFTKPIQLNSIQSVESEMVEADKFSEQSIINGGNTDDKNTLFVGQRSSSGVEKVAVEDKSYVIYNYRYILLFLIILIFLWIIIIFSINKKK